MGYQFVVQLPKNLEAAYRAGKIVVDSGVAREVGGKAIAGHLEMVSPHVVNLLSFSNPYAALASTGIKTINDTRKLNQIISLTNEIKTLASINLAISGTTIGIAVAGLTLILCQLKNINNKLDNVNQKIYILDKKVSDLAVNELGKITSEARKNIKHCITLINQLEDLEWSEYLDTEIAKLLDNIEILMERILSKYIDRDEINISIELAQCLQSAYANLLKAYLTKRYLKNKSLDYPMLRLQTLKSFSQRLCVPEILDGLYEEYLFSKERRFTEGELDVVLALYRHGCQYTSDNVNVHYEILQTTSRKQFRHWQKLLKASNQPLIWLEHKTP